MPCFEEKSIRDDQKKKIPNKRVRINDSNTQIHDLRRKNAIWNFLTKRSRTGIHFVFKLLLRLVQFICISRKITRSFKNSKELCFVLFLVSVFYERREEKKINVLNITESHCVQIVSFRFVHSLPKLIQWAAIFLEELKFSIISWMSESQGEWKTEHKNSLFFGEIVVALANIWPFIIFFSLFGCCCCSNNVFENTRDHKLMVIWFEQQRKNVIGVCLSLWLFSPVANY